MHIILQPTMCPRFAFLILDRTKDGPHKVTFQIQINGQCSRI